VSDVQELSRIELLSAVYSLAAAYESTQTLSVGDRVFLFRKTVSDGYEQRGPVSRAVVTEVLNNGKAVEVEYPDGERDRWKCHTMYGWAVVKEQGT
jgi:hypothetical protein